MGPMPRQDATYSIQPIEPEQVSTRFVALLDRIEPFLAASDVSAIRSSLDAGDQAAAFAILDEITNDRTISVETATLVEIVLLGQAIRTS